MQTKICSNCQKQISITNHFLHTTYCQRHYKKCKDCKKLIKTSEEQKHRENDHILKYCIYCKELLQKILMKPHLLICEEKPVKCRICEIDVLKENFEEHFLVCGNRTNECPYCGIFVQLKDFDGHLELCIKIFSDKKDIRRDLKECLEEAGNGGKNIEDGAEDGEVRGNKGNRKDVNINKVFSKNEINGKNEDSGGKNGKKRNLRKKKDLEIKSDMSNNEEEKGLYDNNKKQKRNLRKAKKKRIYKNEKKIEFKSKRLKKLFDKKK